jgi:hypothetical protein
MPLPGTGLSITESLAHVEYDALRSIVHSAAEVDVKRGPECGPAVEGRESEHAVTGGHTLIPFSSLPS